MKQYLLTLVVLIVTACSSDNYIKEHNCVQANGTAMYKCDDPTPRYVHIGE